MIYKVKIEDFEGNIFNLKLIYTKPELKITSEDKNNSLKFYDLYDFLIEIFCLGRTSIQDKEIKVQRFSSIEDFLEDIKIHFNNIEYQKIK